MLKTEYIRCRASLEREIVMAEFNILTCVFCEAKVGELDLYNVRCTAVVFASAVLLRSRPCTMCAALSAAHTRVDSYVSASYRVSRHSTLCHDNICHDNIYYTQTHVFLVVQSCEAEMAYVV